MKSFIFAKSIICMSLFMACTSSENTINPALQPPVNPNLNNLYSSSILGSSADVTTTTSGVTICAGGSTDNDDAMKWMLQQSGGGDIVVIRNAQLNAALSATYDAYNEYFMNELGVKVNSVETILLNSKSVAQNEEVICKVKAAECLFFTGGDQATYFEFIKGTGLEEAINYLKNTKKVPVGGTSAGCAIQGKVIFAATNGTITSAEALANPYNSLVTLQRDNFMDTPFMANTITDTHFNNPDRRGRLVTFMAKMSKDFDILPRGIGIEEKTVVCIQPNGVAKVFGKGYAFFCQQNSALQGSPETCLAGSKLDWNRNKQAVKCYQVEGTSTGSNTFDLSSWSPGATGVLSQYYYVDKGTFAKN